MTLSRRSTVRMARDRAVRRIAGLLGVFAAAATLSACQVSDLSSAKALAPIPAALERRMTRLDMDVRSPIMLRIYKEDSVVEVWKEDRAGDYKLLKAYPICAWSGALGPKKKEGDRQAPEGFYFVSKGQMNPNSAYHLSFDLGYPNAFDRSYGRTGSNLMVHGDCSSRGCYSIGDDNVQEIYAMAREAFAGGQSAFQVQALPFRMTAENMARHADSEHLPFWEMLKEGLDHFEVTQRVAKVNVCARQYVFNADSDGRFVGTEACPTYSVDPGLAQLVAAKHDADLAQRSTIIATMMAKEQREEGWEEREKAVASFFNNTRAGTGTAQTPAAGVPTLSATTGAASGTALAATTPADTSGSAAPVTTALPGVAAAQDVPVASVSGVAEPSAPAQRPDEVVGSTAQSPAMGFAPEETEAGFFANVAKNSRGLLRKAGDLFD